MRLALHLLVGSLLLVFTNACSCGKSNPGPDGGEMNAAPTAAFTASATTVVAGGALAFDATASNDPDGDALTFDWSFGDSTRGAASRIAHVFPTAGAFDVTLTVADGKGGTHATTQSITVTAGPTATQMATVTVRVFGSSRTALSGATVQVVGGASATTNAMGVATVMVGTGIKQVLRVEKAGYTRQVQVTQLAAAETTAVLEVSLRALPAAVMLADAAAGGTAEGMAGAKVTLGADALRTAAGAKVTGAVEVQIAPVNVVADPAAFPGRWAGIDRDGTRGALVSFGTVDFVFTQGGARLDLAPGARATVELPVSVKRSVAGVALAAGDQLPLWSLDENSGEWIREGEGTLVASATAPGGFVQRAEVGHFSWWNCDDFTDVHTLHLKCCIDADKDGSCEGGDVVCFVGGRTCNDATCMDDSNPYPQYGADEIISDQGTDLLMPDDLTIYLDAFGPDGLTRGSYTSAAGTTTSVSATIALSPYLVGPMDQVITLPFDATTTAAALGTATKYMVDATAGQNLWVAVERGVMSSLTGTLKVKNPQGTQLQSLTFNSATASYVQPITTAGRYTIEVTSAPPNPVGSYRLRVRAVGAEMVVLSQTPAVGSAVAAPANLSVTFARPVNPSSITATTFKVFGPLGEVTRASSMGFVINNETVTFNPQTPLGAGLQYRVELTTGVRDTTNTPLIDAYQGTFSTLDMPGSYSGVFPGQYPDLALADDGSALVAGRSGNFIRYTFYTPNVGWSVPDLVPAPAGNTGHHTDVAVAVAPGSTSFLVAYVVGQPNSGNPPFSIYSVTYSPTAGWGTPIEVPIDATARTAYGGLRLQMDATGRAVLVWEDVNFPGHFWFNRRVPGTGWGAAAQIGTATGDDARFALNPDGKGAVLWRVSTTMSYARYDPVTNTFGASVDLGNNQSATREVAVDAAGNVVVLRGTGNLTSFLSYEPADGGAIQTRQIPGANNEPNCSPAVAMTPTGTVAVASCKSGPVFVDRWAGGTDFMSSWDTQFQLAAASSPTALRLVTSGEDFYVAYGQLNAPLLPTWRKYSAGTWDATGTLIGAPLFGGQDQLYGGPTRVFYVYQQGAIGRIK